MMSTIGYCEELRWLYSSLGYYDYDLSLDQPRLTYNLKHY
jgi:hypothetical protein